MKGKTSSVPARHSDCWPPKNFRVVVALRNSAIDRSHIPPESPHD